MHALTRSIVLVAATGAVAGCGGDDSGTDGASRSPSSAAARSTAVREVGATRDALRAALASYRRGDRAAAQEQVAEAYVAHFEEVEGPLEAQDPALKERLEEAIGGDLRSAMREKTASPEVAAAVREVVADLDRAEAALR